MRYSTYLFEVRNLLAKVHNLLVGPNLPVEVHNLLVGPNLPVEVHNLLVEMRNLLGKALWPTY